jgi:hypothetical protein
MMFDAVTGAADVNHDKFESLRDKEPRLSDKHIEELVCDHSSVSERIRLLKKRSSEQYDLLPMSARLPPSVSIAPSICEDEREIAYTTEQIDMIQEKNGVFIADIMGLELFHAKRQRTMCYFDKKREELKQKIDKRNSIPEYAEYLETLQDLEDAYLKAAEIEDEVCGYQCDTDAESVIKLRFLCSLAADENPIPAEEFLTTAVDELNKIIRRHEQGAFGPCYAPSAITRKVSLRSAPSTGIPHLASMASSLRAPTSPVKAEVAFPLARVP